MRRLAIKVAVTGFFALALVGWFRGVGPFTCALRALGGAVGLYFVTKLAVAGAIRVIVNAHLGRNSAEGDTGAKEKR